MQNLRELTLLIAENDLLRNQVLVFTFGSMVSLIVSLISNERRSAARLFAGSMLGGIGAALAFDTFHTESYWKVAVAIAAIGSEWIALGVRRIFSDFSKSPLKTVQNWIGVIAAYAEAVRNVKLPSSNYNINTEEDISFPGSGENMTVEPDKELP